MMKKLISTASVLSLIVLFTGISCNSTPVRSGESGISPQFREYWYQGKAELSRYKLTQARYRDYHEGNAVMIFVTEDFNTEAQVKHNGSNAPKEPILKINFSRKFLTGIYPYSVMTSVFTPVNGNQPSIKESFSAEEWCGHAYMQLNRRGKQYQGITHSYFPNEADREFTVRPEMLEDEIWNRIRINPEELPTGKLMVLPAAIYLRLLHQEAKPTAATATLSEDAGMMVYSLKYEDLNREVTVRFQKEFPYTIEEWEEKFRPLMGRSEWMTTRAIRTHTVMLDYWNRNDPGDTLLRKDLGLPIY